LSLKQQLFLQPLRSVSDWASPASLALTLFYALHYNSEYRKGDLDCL
jgi:hypothetical protein